MQEGVYLPTAESREELAGPPVSEIMSSDTPLLSPDAKLRRREAFSGRAENAIHGRRANDKQFAGLITRRESRPRTVRSEGRSRSHQARRVSVRSSGSSAELRAGADARRERRRAACGQPGQYPRALRRRYPHPESSGIRIADVWYGTQCRSERMKSSLTSGDCARRSSSALSALDRFLAKVESSELHGTAQRSYLAGSTPARGGQGGGGDRPLARSAHSMERENRRI